MEKFPKPSSKLTGATILILKSKGADWIPVGEVCKVKFAKTGKLFVQGGWWSCSDNASNKYFEVLELKKKKNNKKIEPRVVSFQDSDYYGAMVRRGPDWHYGDQDEGSEFGIIQITPTRHQNWVLVKWYDIRGHVTNEASYRIGLENGRGGYDLVYYQQ